MTFRASTSDEALVGTKQESALQHSRIRSKSAGSPYYGVPVNDWPNVTRALIEEHPLAVSVVADAALAAWDGFFNSRLGYHDLCIGTHIFPAPQIMGYFLHELVPYELASYFPDEWTVGVNSTQKDAVCATDDAYSFEIKTSSDPTSIFGNRSYGQQGGLAKKAKDGYYLAVNFERWADALNRRPELRSVRWGWLDHTDWYAQTAQTGQQASLPTPIENAQLLTIYKR